MGIELKREPTADEIEQICTAAEEAAKRHLLSKVPVKRISDLDVMVEAVGDKPLNVSIEVAIELASGAQDLNALVEEATELAFSACGGKIQGA